MSHDVTRTENRRSGYATFLSMSKCCVWLESGIFDLHYKRMGILTKGPIKPAEFAAVLKRLGLHDGGILGVGVSGEAKSLASLLLLKHALGKEKIVAFTVDHKLKDGSTVEAGEVQMKVARLGIEHHIIPVDWNETGSGFLGDTKDPPMAKKTRVAYWKAGAAARVRRYNMLARACKQHGISSLVVGHSLDDQVRVGLSRLNRSSGIEGLAAMRMAYPEVPYSSSPAAKHIRLLRPMLCFNQARLEDTCREYDSLPHDGPSNKLLFLSTDSTGHRIEGDTLVHKEKGTSIPLESYTRFLEHMEEHRLAFQGKVQPLLRDFTLRDPPTGTCFLQVRADRRRLREHWINKPYLADRVMNHVVSWASTTHEQAPWAIAANFRQQVLNYFTRSGSPEPVTGGSVILCKPRTNATGAFIWIAGRSPMNGLEMANTPITMQIGDRALWDGRFFIALNKPSIGDADGTFHGIKPENLKFVVRAFTGADHQSILDRMRTGPQTEWNDQVRSAVDNYWSKMPPLVRMTIPCVALLQDNGDRTYVISVPSLSVNLEPLLVDVQFSFANHTVADEQRSEVGFRMISN
ncbi:hypothetical protein PhCBS80983_g00537 [Powellomyces hirtus]|uniref:tRNA(Ile)-lysidine synthetase n=1 Tax=Powellomyces hirtus TaxID=109895 RepID=A0A507EDS9_9FUNG|nr:hypothetical protein PhCBS80983_g00537 [Powellomyces hirtus]